MVLRGSFDRRGALVLAAALGAACAGARVSPTAADASPGAAAYHHHCGSCHDLFPPHAYSDAEWAGVLSRMAPETTLSADESAEILAWLRERN